MSFYDPTDEEEAPGITEQPQLDTRSALADYLRAKKESDDAKMGAGIAAALGQIGHGLSRAQGQADMTGARMLAAAADDPIEEYKAKRMLDVSQAKAAATKKYLEEKKSKDSAELDRKISKDQEDAKARDRALDLKEAELKGAAEDRRTKHEDRMAALAKEKEIKPAQAAAGTFASRLEQAEKVFGDLQSEGYDPTGLGAEAQKASFFGVGVPERLKSDQFKRQDQAERNFINATLRRESGSAISESEFDSAKKQYFPQPGDPPEVLNQKAMNRQIVLAGLKAEAGNAYGKIQNIAAGAQPSSPAAPVERKTKEGKIALFDPLTKKFLRYK